MKNKRAVVIPDLHIPLHDEAAVNCVLQAIKIVRPDTIIFLGDVGEFEGASHWKWKKKKRPPTEYILPDINRDIKDVNKVLDEFDKVCNDVKNKYFLAGNHCEWLTSFVEENPFLPEYLPEKALKLKERGYKYYPYGEYLTIGELSFTHGGHFKGIHHARASALGLGVNIAYAHFHDVSRASTATLKGVHAGFCLGCLKKMDNRSNQWLKGKGVNWGHAFSIVDWYKNGNFRLDLVDITAGRTTVWGREIDGNK